MIELQPDSAVLVIIDLQERLLPVIPGREEIIANNLKLIESLSLLGLPVVFTEQYRRLLGPTVGRIKEKLQDLTPTAKMSFNCCREPGFLAALESSGKKQIILTGVETHVCLLQTAINLQKLGFQVYLAADAGGSRHQRDELLALAIMRQAGVVVCSTEMIIFQLLRTAEAEEYKKILKIIK